MNFPAGGERGFSCSSAPLPTSWAGTATLQTATSDVWWRHRVSQVPWLLWKAVALKFILWLSDLTVETVDSRCSEWRIQHRSYKRLFFFLREKIILEKNSHTLWHTFTLNFWRKENFFLCLKCLAIRNTLTTDLFLCRATCTNLGNDGITCWELSLPHAQKHFSLAGRGR